MFGSLIKNTIGIASDLTKIAVAPLSIAVEATRVVTKPVAEAVEETAKEVNKELKDVL